MCTRVSWIKSKERFCNYHFPITQNSFLWMLWHVAQILCQNRVVYVLSSRRLGLTMAFSRGPLQVLFSAKPTAKPPHRNSPDLMTASSSSIRTWPLGLKLGQLLEGRARSSMPHGVVWTLPFNSFALQLPPAQPCLLQPHRFLSTSPRNPAAHNSQMDVSLDLTYYTFIANSTAEVFLFCSISFIFCFQSLPEQSYICHF